MKPTTALRTVLSEVKPEVRLKNRVFSDGRKPKPGIRAVGIKIMHLHELNLAETQLIIEGMSDLGFKIHSINYPKMKESTRAVYFNRHKGIRFIVSSK
ncbi:MAG: hypothetical protein WD512_00565 [Candidatus Paceibacterota bacterium]